MDSAEEIGARLARLRKALGHQQAKAFAEWIGTPDTTWNTFERGHRRITFPEVMKVVNKTGASLDWIYRGLEHTLPKHLADKLEAFDKAQAAPPANRQASNG